MRLGVRCCILIYMNTLHNVPERRMITKGKRSYLSGPAGASVRKMTRLEERYMRDEFIIVSAEQKKRIIFSLMICAVMVAVEWFTIGYWIGKKRGSRTKLR